MHDYQVARGFDPTTPDFARFLGYPVYKVTSNDQARFKVIHNDGREFIVEAGIAANGASLPASDFPEETKASQSLYECYPGHELETSDPENEVNNDFHSDHETADPRDTGPSDVNDLCLRLA
ncbi:hypothetical protein AAF712_009754 [Marasmius tenuissimus]|uniref:Uncharacterized protein n=1 Tax=Marasmius tenuissimus TaxID=585030 RepID=A0ABR2ZQT1_9AGAR